MTTAAHPVLRRAAQALVAAAGIALLPEICRGIPHITGATVVLLMVLCIGGIARIGGTAEALTAAVVGGLIFDYYFLSPDGFGIGKPEGWITLAAFLIAAAGTSQLVAQSNRRRIEALEKQRELEVLHQIGNALSVTGVPLTQAALTDRIAQLVACDGIAVYEKRTGRIVRSHPRAGVISDAMLYEAAASGRRIETTGRSCAVTPLHHNGELTGSMGIMGGRLSPPFLDTLGAQVGLCLERLHLVESATEAEVVRRSEELKSAALDAMAHEIRNPLNSVKLAASVLRYPPTGISAEMRELIAMIEAEADRMERCIDDAVRLTRTAAGDVKLRRREQSVSPLIADAVEGMGPVAVSRPVEVEIPESLPPVMCDREMILHVLKQLLGNALKYSPDDSPIAVTARAAKAAVVVSIADCGPGVAEEERERIFEEHYRGSAACFGAPGSGMGLSAAKSIMRAHGGSIWVTSPSGGGAAFHLSLPAALAAAKSAGVS